MDTEATGYKTIGQYHSTFSIDWSALTGWAWLVQQRILLQDTIIMIAASACR